MNDAHHETAAASRRYGALAEALQAAGTATTASNGSDTSIATSTSTANTSESPSEDEDYDKLPMPSADSMVLRQRRPQTRLRHELVADVHGGDSAAGEAETAKTAKTAETESNREPSEDEATATGLSVPRPFGTSSRESREGRKLSATVIFEEQGVRSMERTVSSSALNSPSTVATIRTSAQMALSRAAAVISIDDPALAQMLREDFEAELAELAELEDTTQDRSEAGDGKSVHPAHGSHGGDHGGGHGGSHGGHGSQHSKQAQQHHRHHRHHRKFRDFVFTSKFSAFDWHNEDAANSPFHGFFALFWIAVFLFLVKIAANNWQKTGSPLGTNEIMSIMFHRDVVVLLASDGILCALTGVSWLIQRFLVAPDAGWIDWDGAGWVLQNAWQLVYVAGFIGWTQLRDWPWTHTVFFVLHGLVMLMKQHSYAFYNGYLSTVYKRRAALQVRLDKMNVESEFEDDDEYDDDARTERKNDLRPVVAALQTPLEKSDDNDNNNIDDNSGKPDKATKRLLNRVLRWECSQLSEELRGKASQPERAYPHNLTLANHYEYIALPTLVYELEYPRSESISWSYAAEKLVACFGIIFAMISISQAFVYPVVMQAVAMKEANMPFSERFRFFPMMLSDLIFPFMMEYLLAWYLIWETILNFLAELTFFADRSFYAPWWNSVTWDEYARDWNRPVHLFLLRHVYHSSISAMKVNKHTATLITFFLSSCVHELVMACIFRKVRGYLLFLQMCQLPLVRLSRTKFLRNRRTLGNVMFWFGLFMGPSLLCCLYLIL